MTIGRRVAASAAALLLVLAGVGFYYSSQALEPGGVRVLEHDLAIVDLDGGVVTLPLTDDTILAAVGLVPEAGGWYAQLTGEPRPVPCDEAETCVRRDFTLVFGEDPEVGEDVAADVYFHPPDLPGRAVEVEVQELLVDVPGGTAPAWWIPPRRGDLVVVGIHGRGASRAELLRAAQVVVPAGHGLLVPTYRGDGVAPPPPDGLGRFGTDAWLDVALAMLHDEVGPNVRFVLLGVSQGGAVASTLLREGDVADRVVGLVLDSPLLGLDATMEVQARLAGIPSVLTRPVLEAAYAVSRLRGFDFTEGEHVDFLADSELPTLLFHGPGDTFVAWESSDALAQLRPDITYVRVPGVDHVRFWNHDPAGYTDAVRAFLDGLPGTTDVTEDP